MDEKQQEREKPISRSMARRYAVQGDMTLIPNDELAQLRADLDRARKAVWKLMEEREDLMARYQQALYALVSMVEQYLNEPQPLVYDTVCMHAGESAMRALIEAGLAENVTEATYKDGSPIYRLMRLKKEPPSAMIPGNWPPQPEKPEEE